MRFSRESLKTKLVVVQIVVGAVTIAGALAGAVLFITKEDTSAGRTKIDPSVVDLVRSQILVIHKPNMISLLCTSEVKSGVEKNQKLAFDYIKKAAEQGHVGSESALGWFYDSGFGVPRNPEKALFWNTKASAAGDGPATNAIAWYYRAGTHGLEKDIDTAISLFQRSCDSGYDLGCVNLGNMYLFGNDVGRDCDQALRLIGLAVSYAGFDLEQSKSALDTARAICS